MAIEILNPIAARQNVPRSPIAPRISSLEGATIGVIDNRRPNADIFTARLIALLRDRCRPREIVLRRKPTVAEAAPFLDELVERCDVVVNAVVDHGACMAWSPGDTAELERRGTPVATVCAANVSAQCREELAALGVPGAPIVDVSPISELPPSAVPAAADQVVAEVVRVLTTPAEQLERAALAALTTDEGTAEPLRVEDRLESFREVNDYFVERGWTDGLPVVPPTAELVEAMLSRLRRAPSEIVGVVPPRRGLATLEKIAVNAVMAGCRPEHFPVVVAALEAMLADEFNLAGIQTTTNPCGPLLIINGPLASMLGVNASFGALGPGSVANACLGRATRLLLLNLGGARPGREDRATQGQPGKYTFCFAENEAESPWEPLHVERGFSRTTSTVTVVAAEGPHNINDHVHADAEGILSVAADSMATLAHNLFAFSENEPLLVLAPYHARCIAADGFAKDDVKRFLHQRARRRLADVRRGGMWGLSELPTGYPRDDDSLIPITLRWEDFMVVVAGGTGKHSSWVPTFGRTRSVTRPI